MKFHTFQLFLMLSTKFWLIHCDIQPRTAKGKRFLRSPDPEFLCLPSCKMKPQTPSAAYLEHTHILRTVKGLTPPWPQTVAHSRQPEQIPQFSVLESHTVAPGHNLGSRSVLCFSNYTPLILMRITPGQFRYGTKRIEWIRNATDICFIYWLQC